MIAAIEDSDLLDERAAQICDTRDALADMLGAIEWITPYPPVGCPVGWRRFCPRRRRMDGGKGRILRIGRLLDYKREAPCRPFLFRQAVNRASLGWVGARDLDDLMAWAAD